MDLNTIVHHSWVWTWLEAIPARDKIAVWVSASAKRLVSIGLTEDVIVPALWCIWINKKVKEFRYFVFTYNTKPRWTALTRSRWVSNNLSWLLVVIVNFNSLFISRKGVLLTLSNSTLTYRFHTHRQNIQEDKCNYTFPLWTKSGSTSHCSNKEH